MRHWENNVHIYTGSFIFGYPKIVLSIYPKLKLDYSLHIIRKKKKMLKFLVERKQVGIVL